MKVPNEYTRLLIRVLLDYKNFMLKDEDIVYIVRGRKVLIYDSKIKDIVVYKKISDYYLFLEEIEVGKSFERIKVNQLIEELFLIIK